jgi:hypothetical protein
MTTHSNDWHVKGMKKPPSFESYDLLLRIKAPTSTSPKWIRMDALDVLTIQWEHVTHAFPVPRTSSGQE